MWYFASLRGNMSCNDVICSNLKGTGVTCLANFLLGSNNFTSVLAFASSVATGYVCFNSRLNFLFI